MQLAIALYNNTVDNEEELAFRKGDILTVLIENPHGLDGWWLCQHRGKCGLCPGNRLQLLSSSPPSINANDYVQFPSRLSTASVSVVKAIENKYSSLLCRHTMFCLPIMIMIIIHIDQVDSFLSMNVNGIMLI